MNKKKYILHLLKNLSEREQIVLKMYFGFDGNKYTQKEIGAQLNPPVTESAVSLILKKAMKELKLIFAREDVSDKIKELFFNED